MKGLEFYSAAAQIIPLFLILLAFQARSFSPRLSKWAYWIVLFAFIGEFCALLALYTEHAYYYPWVVWIVLIMLGVLVFLAIVLAPHGAALSMRPSTRKDEDA